MLCLPDVLNVVRGDQLRLVASYQDAAGAPVSLTGYTFTAPVTWSGGSTAFTCSIVDAAAGRFEIAAEETVTALLPIGGLSQMRLKATTPAGDTVTLGILTVNGI